MIKKLMTAVVITIGVATAPMASVAYAADITHYHYHTHHHYHHHYYH